jgi:hypothetical protein
MKNTCLFRLDNATQESQALKVLSRASTHCMEIDFSGLDRSINLVLDKPRCDIRHFLDNFQAGTLAILFTSLCVRVDDLIMEFADSLLQPTMALEHGSECCHDGTRKAAVSIPP